MIASDGDLMEGVSNEASSLAGHLGLDNLVVLYDDNHVTIDGDTSLAFTEHRADRYEALGWRVSEVSDGNDLLRIDQALTDAIHHQGQPCLISVKTIIGFGSRDAGTSKAHSDARGAEQQAETKQALGFDPERFFVIPEQALAATGRRSTAASGWPPSGRQRSRPTRTPRSCGGSQPAPCRPGSSTPRSFLTTARWRPAPGRAR